jgi:ATP-dependent RNA helicase DDX5/DBP2
MWSATWPKEVQALARDFLKDPIQARSVALFNCAWFADFTDGLLQVYVGSLDIKASHHIVQEVLMVEDFEKHRRLISILEKVMDGSRILIFTETKKNADTLTRNLRQDGWPALAIHGDKSQQVCYYRRFYVCELHFNCLQERDWVLAEFKSGKSPLMVATDVASRGLDVKDIRVVINFDFPKEIEDYVHRCVATVVASAW